MSEQLHKDFSGNKVSLAGWIWERKPELGRRSTGNLIKFIYYEIFVEIVFYFEGEPVVISTLNSFLMN